MSKRRGHGEGSVFQRSDGRWAGTADLGWRDGRRIRKTVYGRTQKEAISKLQAVNDAVKKRLPVPDDRVTVNTYVAKWLTHHTEHLSDNTRENYAWAIGHATRAFGKTKLRDLSTDQVLDLLASLKAQGLSASTRMRVRSVLAMVLRQAEIEGVLSRNVATLVRGPVLEVGEGRSLTVEQARDLIEEVSHHRLGTTFLVMLTTGLRPGEALGLTWENVELETGVLRVRQALVRESAGLRLGPPKTPKSRRSLLIPELTLAALRTHRRQQAKSRLIAGPTWTDHDLVFCTGTGGFIDPSNLRRSFDRITKKVGIGHWTPNELRHSAVSLLHAAGVPMQDIADVVGHDGTRMTTSVYRHLLDDVVDKAAAPMDQMFGKQSG